MPQQLTRKHILFVCVENSNRSQMAQAFARMYGGEAVDAHSAGSRPSGMISPKAVAAMRELGYDLAAHVSKSLESLPDVEWEAVVGMGCGDTCPMVRAKRHVEWSIPDPKHMEPGEFNRVRDLIADKVRGLLAEESVLPARE